MKHFCSALFLSAAASWFAAAPSFSQQAGFSGAAADGGSHSSVLSELFELNFQADADILAAAGGRDPLRDGPYADLSLRLDADAVTQDGLRWGGEFEVRARTGDGRRGFSRPAAACPGASCRMLDARPAAGMMTGLHGEAGLDRASSEIRLERAQVYVQNGWARARAGVGGTAAAMERPQLPGAFRLSRADGPLADPSGAALASTSLSLSGPAPGVSVQSRRIAGFRASASYAPDGEPCGADTCRPPPGAVARAEVRHIWSAALSFDRRMPSTGQRWEAFAGVERGRAEGDFAPYFEDPWAASARLVWSSGDVSLGAGWLAGNDGLESARYSAVSLSGSLERGDWLFSAEAARGKSRLVDASGFSLLTGASRFVGHNALIGIGVLVTEERRSRASGPARRSGAAVFAEAGLRF